MPERYKGFGYWDIATRQMSIVTKSQQTRFKDAKIGIVGCGGIGGATIGTWRLNNYRQGCI